MIFSPGEKIMDLKLRKFPPLADPPMADNPNVAPNSKLVPRLSGMGVLRMSRTDFGST
jgi:hypothetical protein